MPKLRVKTFTVFDSICFDTVYSKGEFLPTRAQYTIYSFLTLCILCIGVIFKIYYNKIKASVEGVKIVDSASDFARSEIVVSL